MTERSRSGKTAWDKEKTRELFRRYKETGDPDAREQLVMSHMNLVRFLANKFKNRGEPLAFRPHEDPAVPWRHELCRRP